MDILTFLGIMIPAAGLFIGFIFGWHFAKWGDR